MAKDPPAIPLPTTQSGLSDVYAAPKGDERRAKAGTEDTKSEGEDARSGAPWAISTYFAEGLPFSMVHQVSTELFTAMGAGVVVAGYTSYYGIAWNLKFLWSPIVGRYGTLRRWIVVVQLLLAAVLGFAAMHAGEANIAPVAIALIPVSFLGATQDIAVDGYYLAALNKSAQASLSGTRVGAYRVALLVGKSWLVALAGYLSWRASFGAAALIMLALAILHAITLRPLRGTTTRGPSTPGGALREFIDSFLSYLRKPNVGLVIAFILTFKAGDALLFNMSVPFLKHLGLDTQMRGLLSTPSLIAAVAGTWVGGVWIKRKSLAKTLVPIAVLQALAIPLYSALAILRPSLLSIGVAVSIEQLIAGLGNAALLVFLMQRADGAHKTAHFAIGTALMSLPLTLVGTVSGRMVEAFGFTKFFVVSFLLALPGVLLAQWVPKR